MSIWNEAVAHDLFCLSSDPCDIIDSIWKYAVAHDLFCLSTVPRLSTLPSTIGISILPMMAPAVLQVSGETIGELRIVDGMHERKVRRIQLRREMDS
jgi:hypothetical protein